MQQLSKLMVLFVVLVVSAGGASAQQPYDEDDEEALARQQYAAEAQAQAQAQQFGYVGVHPIPYENGSGFCYQTGAHFHEYPPFDQYLFRESGGWFYFIGDVGDFGYNQQVWGYNGNHPIPGEWGGGYCYISWGHRHPYAPPPRMTFNFVGGYYVYGGGWDPGYWAGRDRYLGYYGGYYRSNYFGGRYYSVRPPHVYRSHYGFGSPGVYHPGVTVTGPRMGIGINVPAPRVVVPAPRVYAPAPRVYAPTPAPRVYAPTPAPRVYAPTPAPRVYAPTPAPRVYAPTPAPRVYAPTPAPRVYAPTPAPAPVYRRPAPAPSPGPRATVPGVRH